MITKTHVGRNANDNADWMKKNWTYDWTESVENVTTLKNAYRDDF